MGHGAGHAGCAGGVWMRQAPRHSSDPARYGALNWLRGAERWLRSDIEGSWHPCHRLSGAELLGKIEAHAFVMFAIESIKADSLSAEKARMDEIFRAPTKTRCS